MIGDERKKHEEEKVKANPQNDRKKVAWKKAGK